MVLHSKELKAAIHIETANYCSGGGTTPNQPVELVAADLTQLDRVLSFKAPIPKIAYDVEYDINANGPPSSVQKVYYAMGQGSLTTYLQSTNLLQNAINGNLGEIPYSFDMRYDDGDGEKDIYGIIITDYELKIPAGAKVQPVNQNMSLMAARAKVSGITDIVGGIPDFLNSAPVFSKDVSFTIDGKTEDDLIATDLSISLSRTINDNPYQHNAQYLEHPYLTGRQWSISLSAFEDPSGAFFADEMSTTLRTFSCSIVLGALGTLSFSSMYLAKTSQSEITRNGLIQRQYTIAEAPGNVVSFV